MTNSTLISSFSTTSTYLTTSATSLASSATLDQDVFSNVAMSLLIPLLVGSAVLFLCLCGSIAALCIYFRREANRRRSFERKFMFGPTTAASSAIMSQSTMYQNDFSPPLLGGNSATNDRKASVQTTASDSMSNSGQGPNESPIAAAVLPLTITSTVTNPTGATTVVDHGKALSLPGFLMMMEGQDYTVENNNIAEGGGGYIKTAKLLSAQFSKRAGSEKCIIKILKTVPEDEEAMEALRTNFYQEVAITHLFDNSPYFVKIIGYCPDPMAILLKHYSRGSIADLIRESDDPLGTWVNVARTICCDTAKGIAEMHRAGIVSNDIKPDNLLLDPTDAQPYHTVLCDFGVAQVVEESLMSVHAMKKTRIKGASLAYAAPEIINMLLSEDESKYANYDMKPADVYAYAITCFEILARDNAWRTMEDDDIVAAVLSEKRPSFNGEILHHANHDSIAYGLIELIQSCWSNRTNLDELSKRLVWEPLKIWRNPSFYKGSVVIPNGDIVFVMDGICERRPPRLRLWRHQESELIDIDIGPRAPLISFEEVRFYRNSYGSFLVFTSSCRDESMKYPLKLHAFDMEGSGDWLEGSEFGIYLVPGTPRSVVVYGDMLLLAFENQRMIIQGFELIQLGNKFVDTDKHFVSETLYDFLLEPEESGPRKAGHSMLATGNKIYLVGCVAGCKTGETGFWIGICDPHSDGNKLKFRSGIIDLPLRTSQPIISAFDDGELVLLMGGKPVNYKKGFSFDRRMCIMKTGTGRYLCLLQDVVPDFGTSIEENRITSADFVTFPTEFGLRNATLVRWSNSSFQAVYLGYFLDPGEILRDSTKRTTQYALTTSIISNNGENTMIIPSTTTPDLFGIRFSELAGQPFERSALFFILTTLAILIFFGTLFLVYSSARRRLEAKKKNSEKITSTRLSTLGTSKVSIRDEESPNEDHTKTEMSSFTNASTLMTLGRTLAIPGFLMLLQDVDFEVGGQINEGAGGKISSCRIKSTGEECILKTIKAMKDADSEDMRTIFFQEVATMWLFKDSFYVLKLVGYCPEPMGIITKKCQYGSLSALIHENVDLWHETDWDNIVYSVANDVAHGMNEIHSTGLVHSDIKPDNILFDPVPTSPYHVVICDFGVATVVDESLKRVNEMKLSRLIGASLIYSAPEVLSLMNQLSQLLERSDPTILKAADVYAYAVTLYETVAKVQPYGGIPSSSIQEMVLKGQRPVLPPAVIKRVKDPRVRKIVNVINSAWTQDPEMRPSFQRIIDMLQ